VRAHVVHLLGGALFGVGLVVSGMYRPQTVLAFLQLHDLGLLLTMGAALAVAFPLYRLTERAHVGPLDRIPPEVRPNHVLGGIVFGVGWGLAGVCPGAAFACLGTGNPVILWSLAGMLLGAYAQGRLARPSGS